jgi:hypothetical protein
MGINSMNWDPIKYRIFETISGSQMYGTNTPESDIDYRGVCIPPIGVLLDPIHGFEQKDSGFEEEDRTIYALAQFFKLCAAGNPNIIELLFSPEKCCVFSSDEWIKILEHRDLFVSKKVKFTFSGYAFSQLKAIQQHRKWFIDPPKEKPTRNMFNLTDSPRISGEGLQAVSNIAFDLLKDEFQEEIRNELFYRKAKEQWDNYQSWAHNRNPKRMELENKFGYDTKHASHLIRLMYEGIEILNSGSITFPLIQKDEIIAVRNGKYSYDQIIAIAESFDGMFDMIYDISSLPHSPDWDRIKKLYFELIKQ